MPRLIIKELAEEQGLNQSQLQIKAGVTPALMNRYWRNTAGKVTLSKLGKIARALGVATGALITDNGEVMPTTESGKTVLDVIRPGDLAMHKAYGDRLFAKVLRLEKVEGQVYVHVVRENGAQYRIPIEEIKTLTHSEEGSEVTYSFDNEEEQ